MIPLLDRQDSRYGDIPIMTLLIIGVNFAVFFWETTLSPWELYRVFFIYGTIPADIWNCQGAGMVSSLTATFLHGDFSHIISNMLFLWVFGRRVEDACGAVRFLFFYLLAGSFADLVTALVEPRLNIPSIGASGAIFGVLGAYMLLYPGGKIRVFIPIIHLVGIWPQVSAFWFVLFYLLIQIPPAIVTLMTGANFGVGHWAHIGGFLACGFIPLFLRPDAFARFISDKHSVSIE